MTIRKPNVFVRFSNGTISLDHFLYHFISISKALTKLDDAAAAADEEQIIPP